MNQGIFGLETVDTHLDCREKLTYILPGRNREKSIYNEAVGVLGERNAAVELFGKFYNWRCAAGYKEYAEKAKQYRLRPMSEGPWEKKVRELLEPYIIFRLTDGNSSFFNYMQENINKATMTIEIFGSAHVFPTDYWYSSKTERRKYEKYTDEAALIELMKPICQRENLNLYSCSVVESKAKEEEMEHGEDYRPPKYDLEFHKVNTAHSLPPRFLYTHFC